MLKQTCFSLASVVALGGLVWSAGANAGCSSSDSPATGDTDAGNTSSSSGGTDSGSSGGNDSGTSSGGNDSGSKADTGTKTGVAITYGKCPAFTKCGGDVVGSWKVSGGCLSEDTFAPFKEQCPGLQESNVVILANGTINVSATNVKRDTETNVTAHLVVPQSCSPIADPNCTLIPTGLTSGALGQKFDKADCKVNAKNCDCDVELSIVENTDDTYTSTPDGTLTVNGTKGDQTFDFCVNPANKLTFQETTKDALPFIVESTK